MYSTLPGKWFAQSIYVDCLAYMQPSGFVSLVSISCFSLFIISLLTFRQLFCHTCFHLSFFSLVICSREAMVWRAAMYLPRGAIYHSSTSHHRPTWIWTETCRSTKLACRFTCDMIIWERDMLQLLKRMIARRICRDERTIAESRAKNLCEECVCELLYHVLFVLFKETIWSVSGKKVCALVKFIVMLYMKTEV